MSEMSAPAIRRRRTARLSECLNIRLDPETLVELRRVAAERGIGPTTLVRMVIREQLRQQKRDASSRKG